MEQVARDRRVSDEQANITCKGDAKDPQCPSHAPFTCPQLMYSQKSWFPVVFFRWSAVDSHFQSFPSEQRPVCGIMLTSQNRMLRENNTRPSPENTKKGLMEQLADDPFERHGKSRVYSRISQQPSDKKKALCFFLGITICRGVNQLIKLRTSYVIALLVTWKAATSHGPFVDHLDHLFIGDGLCRLPCLSVQGYPW